MSARRCSMDGSEYMHVPRLLCFGWVRLPPVKRNIPCFLRLICFFDTVEGLAFMGRVLFMGTTQELDEAVAVLYILLGTINLSQVVCPLTILHQKTLTDDRSFLNFQRVKKFYHKSVKFLYVTFWLKVVLFGVKACFFLGLAIGDSEDLLLPFYIASKIAILTAFCLFELFALYFTWSGLCAIYDRILRSPCDCHSGVENADLFHRYHTPLFMTQNAIAEAEDEEEELRTAES